MKRVNVQTQLSFEKHSGNTQEFQDAQQQRFSYKTLSDCHKCLRSVFRLQEFRGDQLEIVEAVLKGCDVLVIMPTGGGKSLCYQLPAVLSKGITIVVSPLLALIHDQSNTLLRLGVNAAALNSSVGKKERARVMADLGLSMPTIKLLYVTPELLATAEFRKHIAALGNRGAVARLVIDEAHCISEWGHDFRKDYARLDYFRIAFPNLPILALTATATERVRQDIKKTLGLPDPPELCLFMSSFNRENLYYEVRFDNKDRYENFLSFLRGVYKSRTKRLQAATIAGTASPCASFSSATVPLVSQTLVTSEKLSTPKVEPVCGIIYCGQRLTCEDLAARLIGDGIKAAAFHSGMTSKQRENVQRRWFSADGPTSCTGNPLDEQSVDVIVATIAFGMGIDKPNVRFVCHWELPKTIEGYYQESGRAGRDGQLSRCILYYSREDRSKIEFLLQAEKERRRLKLDKGSSRSSVSRKTLSADALQQFQKMVDFCENTTQCRHVFLCKYFGESNIDKQVVCRDGARCDICRTPDRVVKEKAEKLSSIHIYGHQTQYMGGSKTFIGADGTVNVEGSWTSASVALGRFDPDLIGYEDQDGDEPEHSLSDEGGEDPIEVSSNSEREDEDYDSEAERKAKRRKLLFGQAVDPSYYKKSNVAPVQPPNVEEAIKQNRHSLCHATSTKVELKFREMCYETVERALSSLFQGSKSLTTEYFSRSATSGNNALSKDELVSRLSGFVKKLAVEIERAGFEVSGTQNIYKTVLGHRVRDIKAFETQARLALSSLSSQSEGGQGQGQGQGHYVKDMTRGCAVTPSAKPNNNQAWATAVELWNTLQ